MGVEMQVAGIRRIVDRVELFEVGELRPLADDEVMAAGVGNWDEFGQLPIPVGASPLADAAQALARVAGGHAAGAVVLTP